MHPTIVLTTSTSGHEPRMRSWGRFRDHVRSSLAAPTAQVEEWTGEGYPGQGPVSFWRLFAPNHRELARAFVLYSSLPSARSHLAELLERRGQLTIVTLRGSEPRTHGWYATLDGSPQFTCSRWYGGNAAAGQAGLGAIHALEDVQIAPTVRHPVLAESAVSELVSAIHQDEGRLR